MSELDDIDHPGIVLHLGGKDRRLNFGFKAWKAVHRDCGGLAKILNAAKDDPEGFMIDQFPKLLVLAVVPEGEAPTLDEVEGWLDGFDMPGLQDLSKKFMGSLMNSAPQMKEGKADPPSAEGT